jgi:hypothetical protein
MTRPTGRRVQPRARNASRTPVVPIWFGVVLSGAVWVFLVGSAVDFVSVGLVGETIGWMFAFASVLGAATCLVLLMVLVARALRAHGFISDYKPRRAQARRRA